MIQVSEEDPHYVGLSGIEFFDAHGSPIDFNDNGCSYYAEPADINTLPEYNSDPRTVDKLFDNNNFTCDDMHVWLAPLVLPRTGSALPKISKNCCEFQGDKNRLNDSYMELQ